MPSATSRSAYQTPTGANAYIPLSELADISLDTGASYIYHERNERFIPIKFSVRGRDLGGAVAEAQQRIAKNVEAADRLSHRLGGRVRGAAAGQGSGWRSSCRSALVLILVLLYGLFNSLRDSLLVLAGIPFAVGGGVMALVHLRPGFQHLGGDRLRLAVRRLGDERHPDHDLLQRAEHRRR